MDVNAPEFIPGALSADAAEFVPLASRRLLPPSLRMSSEAPEFVPGKLGMSNMQVFSMSYDLNNSGSRGITSTQHTQTVIPSNAGFLEGMSGPLCGVEASASFHDNKDWASWSKDVNNVDGDGNWEPEDDVKWDASARWDSEDVVSKMVHPLQARVGLVIGEKGHSVQYMDQLCHGRLSIEQDMADMSTASSQMTGTGQEVLHRNDNLVEGLLCAPEVSHLEVELRAPGDACPEVLGTKVALDVLFPNLERSMDDDMSRGPIALDGNGGHIPLARLGNSVPSRLSSSPVVASEDFNQDFKDWGLSNSRFDQSQHLPPPSFPPPKSPEHGPHAPVSAMGEEWNALDIVESVAAMALGLDMEDEPSLDRLDEREEMPDSHSMHEPATSSQQLAFPPPSSSTSSGGLHNGNGLVSLLDVLPMQDALWQPPPRISPAPAGKLPAAAELSPSRECPAESKLSVDSPTDASGSPGARRHRLLPPPPPSEPPPPPPAELMSRQLPLPCDQTVDVNSS